MSEIDYTVPDDGVFSGMKFELDDRDNMIMTTAMLLGCVLTKLEDGGIEGINRVPPLWRFTCVDGTLSERYRNPITAYDMWLSQVGVYVDPQGKVYLPPNIKEML